MLSTTQQNKKVIRDIDDTHLKNYSGWNRAIAEAALERGYTIELWPELELIQVSNGDNSELFFSTKSPLNNDVSTRLASNKFVTNALLADAGMPVPRGVLVKKEQAIAEYFFDQHLSFPLTVKPAANTSGGEGVVLNIQTKSECLEVLNDSLKVHKACVVEEYYDGLKDYRMLLLNGEFLAATCRIPAYVTGDGKSTIRDLIDQKNKERMRNAKKSKVSTIPVDEASKKNISDKGYSLHSVLKKGEDLELQHAVNAALGGEFFDVTNEVCAKNIEIALDAMDILGLNYAGIDILMEDISQPFDIQRSVIVEVNSSPGITCHIYPHRGNSQPVHEKIVDTLFL